MDCDLLKEGVVEMMFSEPIENSNQLPELMTIFYRKKTGEIKETYITTITKLEIYKIIQNALKEYAQERPENIIINDLE